MVVSEKKSLYTVIGIVLLNCVLILLFDFLNIRTSIIKTIIIFVALFIYLLRYREHIIFLSIKNNGNKGLLLFVLIFCAFISLHFNIDFSSLEFNLNRFLKWLWTNSATAIHEELLLRGVCLVLLLKAFAKNKSGLVFSIFFQAFIFGMIHFINLNQHGLAPTLLQVLFAIMVGFIFGVLVIYYLSLWPAIFIHFGNNSMASLNQYFGGTSVELSGGVVLVVCLLLTLICSFIMYRQSPKELIHLQQYLKIN